MRMRRLLIPLFAFALVAAACGDDDDDAGGDGGGGGDGQVVLLTAMEPEEVAAIQTIFDDMINADADYTAEVEPAGNFEEQLQIRAEGGTLDLAAVPQPGAVGQLAADGSIVALEDLGFDMAELEGVFGEYFLSLGEYEGKHYGMPTNINLKSMVWYPKEEFDAAGYEVPETWDDMLALSDQILADNPDSAPWCIGLESEGATGWPATDWMEDLVLRTGGVETYDQWVNHEIPFDDPAIKEAAQRFGEILFTDGYVLGGAAATADLAFGEAPGPLFQDPPGCWLHRQASFINSFFGNFAEGLEAGVDYDWFPLPPIDQEGTLFAGELTVVGSDRPEVRDFLEQFISQEVQCEMGGVEASSRISPNIDVGADCYANEILADASVVLTDALENDTGRFDASDMMPPEVGSGTFWTGMIDYVRGGPSVLDQVLADIEASWPES